MHQRRDRSQSGHFEVVGAGIPGRRPSSFGSSLSPTHVASSIPLSIVEDEFKHQARLIAYEQLLRCMFGAHFECTPISGGFSGSSVVKITPYDELLGTRDEAVIVKLDSAANIRTEVANSLLAHKALGDIAARILGEPIYFHNEPDGNDYGAFKMELAGACWYIPEFSSATSTMINTFKDVIVFESEDAMISATRPPEPLGTDSSEDSDVADFELRINEDEFPRQFNQHRSFASSVHLEGSRPFGSISNIIKELFGLDGSATRSLRRFERSDNLQPPTVASGYARRISQSDPNHPPGAEFLSQRLPLEIKTDSRVLSVIKQLFPQHSSSTNPFSITNKSLALVKDSLSHLSRDFKIIRGFCHGDLNGSNIIIDAMEGMWMIDFATARKLPLTSDLAKLESSLLFEYCFIPIPWTAFLSLRETVPPELVAKWFRIEDENFILHIYESCMIEANQVRTESDLDTFLESVVGSSRHGWKDVRRLRARITMSSVPLSETIKSAITLLTQNFLPPNLSTSNLVATSGSDLSSLEFGIKHCIKMRKYCLSDIASLWKSLEDELDDTIALNRIDVSLVEFSVLLLREMARIVRYEDVAPWMKVIVAECGVGLSNLIVEEIRNLSGSSGMTRAKAEDTRWNSDDSLLCDSSDAPVLSRLTSSPAVLTEEARKYTRFLRSRFGYITDFISGRQLDVIHQCASFKLFSNQNTIVSMDQILGEENDSKKFLVRSIPGGGKSCFLRQLLVNALDSSYVPLFVPMTDWTKVLTAEPASSPESSALVAWIKSITIDDTNRYNFLIDNLESGKLLLLVDGLDEATERELELICTCLTELETTRIVTTYRTDSLSDSVSFQRLEKFSEIGIAPFDFDQRQFVIKARLGDVARDTSVLRFEAFYETFEKSATQYMPGIDSGGVMMIRSPSFLSMLICYWQESVVVASVSPPSLPAPPSRQVTAASLSRTTTAVIDNLSLLRGSSPQWSVGSSPTGQASLSSSVQNASIADVYRVALSVLVHRYQIVQQTDRSRVRESSKRLMELLRIIAFKMLVSNSTEIEDVEISNSLLSLPAISSEWAGLSNQIKQGKFLLLSFSPGKRDVYRFSLPGMVEFLSAEYLTSSAIEVESLPSLVDLISDSMWTSTLGILVEKAPLKLVRIFERKLVKNEWKNVLNGDNLLHMCARLGHTPVFAILNKSSLLESLIHRPNNDSLLPLHEAARMGRAEICRLLLSSGADPWATTNAGWCPLHFAASSHNREVCSVLIAAQASPTLVHKQPQLTRLSLSGLNMGKRILEKSMTDLEFMESARLVFPELSYFRGRSDTTPDASASVVALEPSEIEFRRTMGAMLSVFWICADKYDDFVRSQPEQDRLSKISWNRIRKWVTTKVNLNSPEAVDAMLCLMAIHDLGKLKDFRYDLAPDYKDHDAAMKYIIQTTPEVLPSLCRLSEEFQYLVRATLALDFNFGQFVQAENLPSNLLNVQDLIATKGESALGFYLFHIFADMSGIMGAKSLEGSAFMTETMFENFSLGIDALEKLGTHSVTEVYDFFLDARAKAQGLIGCSQSSPESRALVRLACQSRVFDTAGGAAVAKAWSELSVDTRSILTTHLNRDGIVSRPGFLIYYAPAFMENSRKNESGAGLKAAMEFLARIYAAAEAEFTSDPAEAALKSVIVIHIAEAAEVVKNLKGYPDIRPDLGYATESNLQSICFRLVRSGGVRKLNEATLRVSPWRIGSDITAVMCSEEWLVTREKLIKNLIREGGKINRSVCEIYPEIDYYQTIPDLSNRLSRCFALISCLFNNSIDGYSIFLKLGPGVVAAEDRVTRRSWGEVQLWASNSSSIDIIDTLLTLCAVQHLGSIERLCVDLNSPSNSTIDILTKYPHVTPSFARLSEPSKAAILAHVSRQTCLWQLITTERSAGSDLDVRDDFSFLGSLIELLATRAESYTESLHQAVQFLRKQTTTVEYLNFRSSGQGIVLGESVASPRNNALFSEMESLAIVRFCCLGNIFFPTGGLLVVAAWTKLPSLERSLLGEFLSSFHSWTSLSDFICACKLNPSIGISGCLRLLFRLVQTINVSFSGPISLAVLADRARSHSVILPFENIEFDVVDNTIIPRALIPIKQDDVLMVEMTKHATNLTLMILTMSVSESMFEEELLNCYPELSLRPPCVSGSPDTTALAQGRVQADEVEFKRLMNSLKSLLWIVTNQYDSFVRNQAQTVLRRSSWLDCVEWITETCSLNNPESVDALIVMLIVSKYGRDVVRERPELVPSFSRLSSTYKGMILGVFGMDFNMGQFLQCENLPVNLNSLKTFIDACGGTGSANGLNFYLVFTFLQMCGLLGAKNSNGSQFMVEEQYRTFKMGADVIQQYQRESVEVIYTKFLIRKGSSLIDTFGNKETSALSKLYSLGRISRDTDARKLDVAFQSLGHSDRAELVDFLLRSGTDSDHRVAIMLEYAPAFMENMRLNGSFAVVSQLMLLLRVFRASEQFHQKKAIGVAVVVNLKTLAFWARDIQFSDSIKQLEEFEVHVECTGDINTVFVTHPIRGGQH